MSSKDVRYFKTTMSMLAQDGPKWLLHIFLLTLVNLIPIVGSMATYGYAYQWSTRSAWGMRTAPGSKNLEVGKLMGLGAIVFVVSLVWSIVLIGAAQLVNFGVSLIPVIGALVSLAFVFITPFLNTIVFVAGQRTAIYNRLAAGFQVEKIYDMCQRDWSGLVRIALMYMWMTILVETVAIALIIAPMLGAALPTIMSMASDPTMVEHMTDAQAAEIATSVLAGIGTALPIILFGVFVTIYLTIMAQVVTINAVGIWTAQFYPECWGPYTEPVPAHPRPLAYEPEVYEAASAAQQAYRQDVANAVSQVTPSSDTIVPGAPTAEPAPQTPEPPIQEPAPQDGAQTLEPPAHPSDVQESDKNGDK